MLIEVYVHELCLSTGPESPFVTPSYFKELSVALKHTTFTPLMLQEPPQPPLLSLSIPRRPVSTPQGRRSCTLLT